MNRNQISTGQMISLMLMFEIGVAAVINLGFSAGRDEWMASLIGMILGAVLFWFYTSISRHFPTLPLTAISRKLLGKYAGAAVGLMYVIYFMYIGSRNLREGSNLINIVLLNNTPLVVITTLMVCCVAYVTYLGFEVLARTAVLLMVFIFSIVLIINVLLFASGSVHVDYILPILADGIGPLWEAITTDTLIVPFGEMILFLMLLPYMRRPEKGGYIGVISIIIGGLLITQTMFLNVASLGLNIAKGSPFPVLSTISTIQISDFIQRVDILVVMTMIITNFYRVALYFTAVLIGASDIFNIPYRKLVIPVAFIFLIWSYSMARNYIFQIEFGVLAFYYVHPLFLFFFPSLLLVAAWIHKRRQRRSTTIA
ncbi:GerAB/ArcD/ProY family transporter [Paenibacillus shunpengii]|uniref:GerAB/ArcD/ProY family transporter n=1 Tax=Paenibacillus shunpengii TaxID=2054424 RepID=A0ABW5SVI6_9BACL